MHSFIKVVTGVLILCKNKQGTTYWHFYFLLPDLSKEMVAGEGRK